MSFWNMSDASFEFHQIQISNSLTFHHIILLYFIILYYIILHYIILYYIVLHYIILYYMTLYYITSYIYFTTYLQFI